MYTIRGALGSPFDRIVAQNLLRSREKRATELEIAGIRAAGGVAAAKIGGLSKTAATRWRPGAEAGEMERARLAAGVRREEIGERATAASATARLKERELGLTEEAFEFEKAFLKKKKKKKGIGAIEEIESIVASPGY